jgi:hypothetical protein
VTAIGTTGRAKLREECEQNGFTLGVDPGTGILLAVDTSVVTNVPIAPVAAANTQCISRKIKIVDSRPLDGLILYGDSSPGRLVRFELFQP